MTKALQSTYISMYRFYFWLFSIIEFNLTESNGTVTVTGCYLSRCERQEQEEIFSQSLIIRNSIKKQREYSWLRGTINQGLEIYIGLACCWYGRIKLSFSFEKSLL